ncbi:mucin-2-like [Neocloeon triangulifer]|uniref:mucin-2-like n=1 Tax=Neocloeon triangulifer TaxID=2078957 RepID=UPI00286EFEE8|nr:mucin-2-like [Neocloeon triangulifer]
MQINAPLLLCNANTRKIVSLECANKLFLFKEDVLFKVSFDILDPVNAMEQKLWRQIFALTCLLPVCLGVATDADCTGTTNPPSACESPTSYKQCQFNPNTGVLELSPTITTTVDCTSGQTCYKDNTKATDKTTPCGAPPPACTVEGKFAFRERGCSIFYSCVSDGGTNFQQAIVTCTSGFEYSEVLMKCEPIATANCSVPLPAPTLPPATTAKQTTSTTLAPTTAKPTVASTTTPKSTAASTTPATTITTSAPCNNIGARSADPKNCRKFMRCSIQNDKIQMVSMQCPWRLKYDENKKICRRNVECGTRSILN